MKTHILSLVAIAALFLTGCSIEEKSIAEKVVASWRGHTIEFISQPSGKLNGIEYYYPKSNKVLYLQSDGKCLFGRYKTEGNTITYSYPNSTGGTFTIEERGGQIVSVQADGNFHTTRIISNDPPKCAPQNIDK